MDCIPLYRVRCLVLYIDRIVEHFLGLTGMRVHSAHVNLVFYQLPRNSIIILPNLASKEL